MRAMLWMALPVTPGTRKQARFTRLLDSVKKCLPYSRPLDVLVHAFMKAVNEAESHQRSLNYRHKQNLDKYGGNSAFSLGLYE
jgi:hypothetical protein